jgi:hypothetical protein
MAETSADWLAGASCYNAPEARRGPGHLPVEYRAEIARLGLVAAASSAFFIAAPLLLAPLPSRALAGAVPLAHAGFTAPPVIVRAALVSTPPVVAGRNLRRLPTTIVTARMEAVRFATPAPPPERRRNVFSRFFRSFIRRPAQPVIVKADAID